MIITPEEFLKDQLAVVCRPHPFSSHLIRRQIPHGSRLTDILESFDLDPERIQAVVYLDDILIEQIGRAHV